MARRSVDLDPVWRALANPTRREMLDALRDGPATTGQLAARFPKLSRFAVMQHLAVLGHGNLVMHRRAGRERFNYLNPVPIQQIADRWLNRYQKPWVDALIGLKDALEGERLRSQTASSTTRRHTRRRA